MPRYVFECPDCDKVFEVGMSVAEFERHKGRPPCKYSKKGHRHRMKQLLTPIPFRMH